MSERLARRRLDVIGLALAAGVISWTWFAAASSGGVAGPFTGLLLACCFALVIGRLAASTYRLLVPGLVVGTAGLLALTTPDVLSGTPLGGPLGYANANGAFFLQAAVAGLMLAAASRATAVRVLAMAAAIGFSVVPFAAKSVTSAALLLGLPLVGLLVLIRAGARVAVAACAGLLVVALIATIVLASTYVPGDRSGSLDRIVDASIDERRVALWHESLAMMIEHPVTGVGVGGFQVVSPTARSDRDARWAHNSFLQQGAETGVIGLILLVLLFLWGFAWLSTTTTPDAVTVLGAVALAGLGIHASVDYVLHFPAIPITTAALVGAAGVVHGRKSRHAGKRSSVRY